MGIGVKGEVEEGEGRKERLSVMCVDGKRRKLWVKVYKLGRHDSIRIDDVIEAEKKFFYKRNKKLYRKLLGVLRNG